MHGSNAGADRRHHQRRPADGLGAAAVSRVTWNGSAVRHHRRPRRLAPGPGIAGPGPGQPARADQLEVQLARPPRPSPGFDDSSWTLADHPVSNASSPSTPVLYASDYGYDHGFVWYRGHFTATGNETGVTLTADGIAPTGAYSVWLNGAFLGSSTAGGRADLSHVQLPGRGGGGRADNVIAVLVENTGNPEGPSGEKVGTVQRRASTGSSAPITWRLHGRPRRHHAPGPVRGVMNEAGLSGADNGWDLPGYPDEDWQDVTLPDSWSARGRAAGHRLVPDQLLAAPARYACRPLGGPGGPPG